MANYIDEYGIEYSENKCTLLNVPYDYEGEYIVPTSVSHIRSGQRGAILCCKKLTSIVLPKRFVEFEEYYNARGAIYVSLFHGCECLSSINVHPRNPYYCSEEGVLFDKEKTCLLRCPQGKTGVYTIPNGVKKICSGAFSGCVNLTGITIPDCVEEIGTESFARCENLTSINIPGNLTKIGDSAFSHCCNRTSIEISNSVTSIGRLAFYGVPNIVYNGTATGSPWGARSINGYVDGWLVYKDASKKELLACPSAATGEIVIPNSVTSIGDGAFEGCKGLTSVTIGNSVTSIGDEAFEGCTGLTSVTIGNRVMSIGDKAFTDYSKYILQLVRSYRQELNERIRLQKEKEELERRQKEEREREEARRIAEEKERQRILREREAEEQRRIQEQQMQELLQDSILFFDTETTGVPKLYNAPVFDSSNWPRLVQLAWLMADKNGNILKRKSVIIKPDGFSILSDASAVHGITTERAQREGQPLVAVLEEFMNDVQLAASIVGHNIDFDMRIVGAELYRLDMDYNLLMDKPCTCTMKSSTDFCAIPSSNSYFGGYKWPSLQELYRKLFNRDYTDAHDALADITATKECFFELKRRGII